MGFGNHVVMLEASPLRIHRIHARGMGVWGGPEVALDMTAAEAGETSGAEIAVEEIAVAVVGVSC